MPSINLKTGIILAHVAGATLMIGGLTYVLMPEEMIRTRMAMESAAPVLNLHSAAADLPSVNNEPTAQETGEAARVHARLTEREMPSPGVNVLAKAVRRRNDLLQGTVTIPLGSASGVTLTLAEHPEWIVLETSSRSARYVIDRAAIATELRTKSFKGLPILRNSEIQSTFVDGKKVTRIVSDALAKPGYDLDIDAVAEDIAKAFEQGGGTVTVTTLYKQPVVTMKNPDGTVKTFELLATGYSDFSNSTPGRLHNVQKVFGEKITNILIAPGETFSLVAAIDAPITLEKGWMEDKGLFGGGVALTPGAGICQSATTIFRAALLAGLPIVEKRNHSLLVDHYELFGIGLDATVFPRFHDVKFKNDTGHDLVMQSYTEGDTAIVSLYGTSDGRSAVLDGPYFAATNKNRPAGLRGLGSNEIGWLRTITRADGSTDTYPIISSFAKPFFHSYVRKYGDAKGMALLVPEAQQQQVMHAAATNKSPSNEEISAGGPGGI